MREYGFSVTRILPYKDKIYDFIYIRENTGHWKPVFSHILCSVSWQFQAKFHMLGAYVMYLDIRRDDDDDYDDG